MVTSNEILPKLREFLANSGIKAKVAATGKVTVEIRLESEDLMAQAFPLEPRVKRPTVRTHATIIEPERKNKVPSEPLPVKKMGFNIKTNASDTGMTPEDKAYLRSIVSGRYSFISATKLTSKVWDTTCREIVWLASGLFADSHKWDSTWLKRTATACGGDPSIVRNRFKDITSVLHDIESCLDYLTDCFNAGNSPWPTREKGRIPRKSLLDFIVSRTKTGTEWSPFCSVLFEMEKVSCLKALLPTSCISIAEDIIKESDYLSSRPSRSMDTYWLGVKKFVDWYSSNKRVLLRDSRNKVRLADIGMAMSLVNDWHMACNGMSMPLDFVHPDSKVWFRFAQWANTHRDVQIPLDR